MGDADFVKKIEGKISALPDSTKLEVLDFVDFLSSRQLVHAVHAEENRFWSAIAATGLDRIWDNPGDDIYGKLLES